MRRLVKEQLAGRPPAATPTGVSAESAEVVAELRRKFLMLVRRVDELIAARRL
jgi:hypothetical protein